MGDPRLTRFVRGELREDEIADLEAELDRRPSLHRALVEQIQSVARATPAPRSVVQSPPLVEGPDSLVLGPPLGEGGMATVRSGVQTNLGRAVAVKTLRDETPEGASLLLQEARLTARLQHPNIVPVHEIIRGHGGELQIVLKQIDGVPWANVLDRPDVIRARFGAEDPLDFNLGVLIALCHALAFAHERGVLHRDIKPSNVMIGNFGEIYLLDWGIAGLWGDRKDPEVAHVEESPVSGTPAFMAPEQLEGEGDVLGPWTDVYLLGATLYYVLAGRAPHAEPRTEDGSLSACPPRARPVVPLGEDVPRGLAALVEQAMAPNPEDRLLTAQEFLAAIETFRRRRGSLALTERAEESLERALAVSTTERRGGDRWIGEAEFGFRAALEGWPDNAQARAGLERITLRRIDLALSTEQIEEAERLLEALQDPPPAALVERIQVVRGARTRRLTYTDRSNWLRAVTVGVVVRTLILAIFAPLWIAGWAALAIWPPASSRPLIGLLVGYIVFGTVMILARGIAILKDHFNRINLLGAALAIGSALAWALVAARLDLGVPATQLGILLVFALTPGVVALTSDPRALLPALVSFGCFVAAAIAPAGGGIALAVSAVAMASSLVINNLRLRRRSRANPGS